jgi:catalase
MGDIDYEQPRALWAKVFKEENKKYLVEAMAKSMRTCRADIKERMISLCTKVHSEFGDRLAKTLEMPPVQAKL